MRLTLISTERTDPAARCASGHAPTADDFVWSVSRSKRGFLCVHQQPICVTTSAADWSSEALGQVPPLT